MGTTESRPIPPALVESEINRRFDYHRPSGLAQDLHQALRVEAKGVARQLAILLPAGREASLAMTALEEAFFWAHAAVARDPSLHEERDGAK